MFLTFSFSQSGFEFIFHFFKDLFCFADLSIKHDPKDGRNKIKPVMGRRERPKACYRHTWNKSQKTDDGSPEAREEDKYQSHSTSKDDLYDKCLPEAGRSNETAIDDTLCDVS